MDFLRLYLLINGLDTATYGTGSYQPPLWKGWQRKNRFNAKKPPFAAPYFSTAMQAFFAAPEGMPTEIPADCALTGEMELNIASAIGLLQVFPVHTKSISLLIS